MAARKVPLYVIGGLVSLLVLYFASLQIPVAGLLLSVLMPLPIALTSDRVGWWGGLVVVLVALAILVYLEQVAGFKAEMLPVVHMAVLGLTLAFLAPRPYPLEIVVGGAALLAMLFQVSVFFVLAQQQGLTLLAYLERTMTEGWTGVMQLLDKDQTLEQQLYLLGLSLADLISLVSQLTPAFLLINNTLVAWLTYLLGRKFGAPRGWATPVVTLSRWEAPAWLIFVLIGAGFLLLVPYRPPQMVAVNILLVCLLLYFFQGLAILAFNFQRFQVPRFLRWITYLLLILVKPAMLVVVLLGLIDLWLDFRRLHPPPSEA